MNHQLDFKTLVLLVATVFLLGVGQVMFKYAASGIDFASARSYLSLPLICALSLYGVATVAWLYVLSKVPLSVAFPFFGLSFLIVPLLSAWLLDEKLHWSTLAGGAVIMIGIVITGSRE